MTENPVYGECAKHRGQSMIDCPICAMEKFAKPKKAKTMTTAGKATAVFQSGLAFRIWNQPVSDDYLWDIKIFWAHMEYNGKDVVANCDIKGFADLDDCLDDCLKYIEEFNKN